MTIFYNQSNRGFTETWYKAGNDPTIDLSVGNWPQFLAAAIKIRAFPTYIYAVRFANNLTPPQSDVTLLEGIYNTYPSVNPLDSADVVSTDAVYHVTGGPGISKRMFLRGLPDRWVVRDNNGNDRMPAQAAKLIDLYFQAAQKNGLQIRSQAPIDPGAHQAYTVQKVSANVVNNKQSDIVLNNPPPWPGNSIVRVRWLGVPTDDIPGFPHITPIISNVPLVLPPVITVNYRLRAQGPVMPAKMKGVLLDYAFNPFTGWNFERFSEHKTGSPFGRLRGRSRSLVKAL
jgi:hypothetical protein